jgi:hypothetical protein
MPVLRWLLVCLIAFSASPWALAVDPPLNSPEQKVLDRWLGTWSVSSTLHKSAWTPEERSLTAKLTSSRAVGGRFVEQQVENSDATSALKMLGYDTERRQYRGWWFSSTGQATESAGVWDERTRTMAWTAATPANTTTTVTEHFVDDETLEWNVTVTDATKATVFKMVGKSVRAERVK